MSSRGLFSSTLVSDEGEKNSILICQPVNVPVCLARLTDVSCFKLFFSRSITSDEKQSYFSQSFNWFKLH